MTSQALQQQEELLSAQKACQEAERKIQDAMETIRRVLITPIHTQAKTRVGALNTPQHHISQGVHAFFTP